MIAGAVLADGELCLLGIPDEEDHGPDDSRTAEQSGSRGGPRDRKVFPALQRVIVNITTTDGRKLSKQLDYPKGDPRNPLSDAEIEEKFGVGRGSAFSQGAGQADRRDLESGEVRVGGEADGTDEGGCEEDAVHGKVKPKTKAAKKRR